MERFLSALEQIFDRLLQFIVRCADSALETLSLYVNTIYHFLRKMLVTMLKILWNVAKLLVFFLAPAFLFSLGDELRRVSANSILKTTSWIMILIGVAGMALIIVGLFFLPFSRKNRSVKEKTTIIDLGGVPSEGAEVSTTLSRPRRQSALLIFVIFAIFLIFAWNNFVDPDYNFQSPLLKLTQESLSSLASLIPKHSQQ